MAVIKMMIGGKSLLKLVMTAILLTLVLMAMMKHQIISIELTAIGKVY